MRTEDFARAINVLLQAAPLFPEIRFLNFGGGLGVPYRPDEQEFDLEEYRRAIVPMLNDFRQGDFADVEFWFEPGRYYTAEAGVLLVETNTVKEANNRVFVGTNSGMGQLMRPAIYGAYHAIENLSNPDGKGRNYYVTGNICESGDLFAADRPIPEIREGDILGLMDAGAYGMSMASTYNLRPLPAEVLVSEDGAPQLIRRRKSAAEMVDEMMAASFER
jgi:diaminopimelate decarboxylase